MGWNNYFDALRDAGIRLSPQAINEAIYKNQLAKANTRNVSVLEEEDRNSSIYKSQLAKANTRNLPTLEELNRLKGESSIRRMPSDEAAVISGNQLKDTTNRYEIDRAPMDNTDKMLKLDNSIKNAPAQFISDNSKLRSDALVNEGKIANNPYQQAYDKSRLQSGALSNEGKIANNQYQQAYDRSKLQSDTLLNNSDISTMKNPNYQTYKDNKLSLGVAEQEEKEKVNKITALMDPMDAMAYKSIISGKGDTESNLLYLNQLSDKYPDLTNDIISNLKNTFNIPTPLENITIQDIRKALEKKDVNVSSLIYMDKDGNERYGTKDPNTGQPIEKDTDAIRRRAGNKTSVKPKISEKTFKKLEELKTEINYYKKKINDDTDNFIDIDKNIKMYLVANGYDIENKKSIIEGLTKYYDSELADNGIVMYKKGSQGPSQPNNINGNTPGIDGKPVGAFEPGRGKNVRPQYDPPKERDYSVVEDQVMIRLNEPDKKLLQRLKSTMDGFKFRELLDRAAKGLIDKKETKSLWNIMKKEDGWI